MPYGAALMTGLMFPLVGLPARISTGVKEIWCLCAIWGSSTWYEEI